MRSPCARLGNLDKDAERNRGVGLTNPLAVLSDGSCCVIRIPSDPSGAECMRPILLFWQGLNGFASSRRLAVWLALSVSCGGFLSAGKLAAQHPAKVADTTPAGPLWISATAIDANRQLLIVIDTHSKNAAIYHVDVATGVLTLKSARALTWDLLVGDFNTQDPKPAALKKMLETSRAAPVPDLGEGQK